MNWYAYVGNDPINSVDPLGLQAGGGSDLEVTAPSYCSRFWWEARCNPYAPDRRDWQWADLRDIGMAELSRNPLRQMPGIGGAPAATQTRPCSLPESLLQVAGRFGVEIGAAVSDAGAGIVIISVGIAGAGTVSGNPAIAAAGATGVAGGASVYVGGGFISTGGAIMMLAGGAGREGFIQTMINIATHRLPRGVFRETAERVVGEALDRVVPRGFFEICRVSLP